MSQEQHHLAFHALSTESSGVLDAMVTLCTDCGCQILDSRGTQLGAYFSFGALVRGSWAQIAKLESQAPKLASKHNIELDLRRTTLETISEIKLPYTIQIIAQERPDTFKAVTSFLAEYAIPIVDVMTESYSAPRTHAPMLCINLTVSIPESISLSTLRDEFMIYCDDRHLDAVMEPCKHS